jgi:hypothetical protein
MIPSWRFNLPRDLGLVSKDGHVTWVNVDAPAIGSMRIEHDSGCSVEEAVKRTELAAAAPALLRALANVARDVRTRQDIAEANELLKKLGVRS